MRHAHLTILQIVAVPSISTPHRLVEIRSRHFRIEVSCEEDFSTLTDFSNDLWENNKEAQDEYSLGKHFETRFDTTSSVPYFER